MLKKQKEEQQKRNNPQSIENFNVITYGNKDKKDEVPEILRPPSSNSKARK